MLLAITLFRSNCCCVGGLPLSQYTLSTPSSDSSELYGWGEGVARRGLLLLVCDGPPPLGLSLFFGFDLVALAIDDSTS